MTVPCAALAAPTVTGATPGAQRFGCGAVRVFTRASLPPSGVAPLISVPARRHANAAVAHNGSTDPARATVGTETARGGSPARARCGVAARDHPPAIPSSSQSGLPSSPHIRPPGEFPHLLSPMRLLRHESPLPRGDQQARIEDDQLPSPALAETKMRRPSYPEMVFRRPGRGGTEPPT